MLSFLFPAALLLLSLLPSASSTSIIYMDYTSGFFTMLPNAQVNAEYDTTYSTSTPGSYRFGVDWNDDATDQFTINIPSSHVTLIPENNASFCTPSPATSPPNQITFTASSIHQCNYTVNWTIPFTGVLTVTYNGGPNTGNERSDAISTFFVATGGVGDPQFVGLRGQSYQVHGIDGAVYNLITDTNLQVNSRFVFLSKGVCPVIDGVPQDNCWSHPGSYMGEMSFQQVVDGQLHSAFLVAGPAQSGFATVQVDGQALSLGAKVTFGSFSVERTGTHTVAVETRDFAFVLSSSDRFMNQALRSKVGLSQLTSHGLIGQTHSSRTYGRVDIPFIEGQVDDYVIVDGNIMGNDWVYNRFEGVKQ